MYRRLVFLGLILTYAALAVCAFADPTADELEQNRRKLDAWRKQPEQLARLRQDLAAFLVLPAERRDKIVQLDHELYQETPMARARLWGVLQRYTDWLDRLTEKDRQAIKTGA